LFVFFFYIYWIDKTYNRFAYNIIVRQCNKLIFTNMDGLCIKTKSLSSSRPEFVFEWHQEYILSYLHINWKSNKRKTNCSLFIFHYWIENEKKRWNNNNNMRMYFFCESILCYHSLYRFIIFHVIRTRDKKKEKEERIVQSTHRI
jgi:hypothetical protein